MDDRDDWAKEDWVVDVERVGEEGVGRDDVVGGGEEVREEVAMTRNVVRSKRITSVALQATASLLRCLVRTEALGISVCTMRDHAWIRFQ